MSEALTENKVVLTPACPHCDSKASHFYCRNGELDRVIGCSVCVSAEGAGTMLAEYLRPME